jgi:hypothetical protein
LIRGATWQPLVFNAASKLKERNKRWLKSGPQEMKWRKRAWGGGCCVCVSNKINMSHPCDAPALSPRVCRIGSRDHHVWLDPLQSLARKVLEILMDHAVAASSSHCRCSSCSCSSCCCQMDPTLTDFCRAWTNKLGKAAD